MIDIGFYQLTQRRAEAVLPALVTKALAAPHRLLIRASDPAALGKIDAALWSFSADSFLAHGIDTVVGDARVASQPVLLSTAADWTRNRADCLAQIGGDIPDDLAGLARVLFLFDADSLETARARWRMVSRAEGLKPVYWRENDAGRFEKAA
jgi:DNA polymerase III subunit chi